MNSSRNYYTCDFCVVHFWNVDSFNKHKSSYCHRRNKLPRSCTVTSEIDPVSLESPERTEETSFPSASLATTEKGCDVERFQPIGNETNSIYIGRCLGQQINTVKSPKRKILHSLLLQPHKRTAFVPGVLSSRNRNANSSFEGSFYPIAEIDLSKYLPEDELEDVTDIDYTQRWLHQQFNNMEKPPTKKRLTSAVIPTPRRNNSTPLVPEVPFAENRKVHAPLESSFYPTIQLKRSKYLHEDEENNENTYPAFNALMDELKQFMGKPPAKKRLTNAVIPTPRRNNSTPLVPEVSFVENRKTTSPLESSFYPTIKLKRSKYLHEDEENNENMNSAFNALIDELEQFMGKPPAKKRLTSAFIPTHRRKDSTPLVPGLPFAGNRKKHAPLESSFYPTIQIKRSKYLHEDEENDENTNPALNALMDEFEQFLLNQHRE